MSEQDARSFLFAGFQHPLVRELLKSVILAVERRRIDADASARIEQADDFQITWTQQTHEVILDRVDDVLMGECKIVCVKGLYKSTSVLSY